MMKYTFNQEPFFNKCLIELSAGRMISKSFKGKVRSCYPVTCPQCKKHKSVMMNDTYMFLCPIEGCIGGVNLHQLISDHIQSESLRKEWNEERINQKNMNLRMLENFEDPNQIKNRRARGKNKPPLTDLERMRIKEMVSRAVHTPENPIRGPTGPYRRY